ncbi:MAG: HAMP domain-containing protein, partial [Gemmatimonadales bacterium]
MASIRTRITASYAFAFAGTMFAFSAVVWAERRELAKLDLLDRASVAADLGIRVLSQTGVTNEPLTIKTRRGTGAADDSTTVTPDSLGREIGPRYKALLDALPGYLIIGDATHPVYESPAVRALSTRDSATLTAAAFRVTRNSDLLVDLEDGPAQLVLVARFEPAAQPVRRVVAGLSTEPIDVAGAQVLFFSLVIAPIILLISAVTAWTLAGRLLRPIDRMVNDVEAISDGRSLHRRIPVEDLGDEIGRS